MGSGGGSRCSRFVEIPSKFDARFDTLGVSQRKSDLACADRWNLLKFGIALSQPNSINGRRTSDLGAFESLGGKTNGQHVPYACSS